MTPLEQAIDAATQDTRERFVLRVAALLEGGSLAGPWGVASVGEDSHGPFQINLLAHPDVTVAQANDPTFAVAYMLPQFRAGIAKIESSRWVTAPLEALAEAIYYAERPAVIYPQARVQEAVRQLGGDLTGDPGDGTGIGSGGNPTQDTGNPLVDAVRAAISQVIAGYIGLAGQFWTRDRLIRIAVVIIGAILIIEGVLFIAAPAVGRVVETVAHA